MRPVGTLTLGVLALAAGSVAALAQSAVISARSGLIHYVEGQVYLGDQAVETKFGVFPEVKENQQLKTEEGRAEVLLTPGVFLRLGENSSFRMLTNRLIDTRLEFLSGSAVVEAEDFGKDNSVTVAFKDARVHPVKRGVYRFDAAAAELRVFDGSAEVTSGDQTVEVKEGHSISLDTLALHKFDKADTDALNRWSERRAEYVSLANVAAADTLRSSMFSGSSMLPGGAWGSGSFGGGWYWNPFFGMYTFVPGTGGMFYSAYGNPLFSPFDVDLAFVPGYYFFPGYYGYGTGYPGYAGVYNGVNYNSVPARRPGLTGAPYRTSGTFAGSSGGFSSGNGNTGRVPSSSPVSNVTSSPVSHGGGGGGASAGGRH